MEDPFAPPGPQRADEGEEAAGVPHFAATCSERYTGFYAWGRSELAGRETAQLSSASVRTGFLVIARIAVRLALIGFIIVGSGCAFLLPRDRERVESPWPTFDEAKEVYDEVVAGETTLEQLHDLGFDPSETPNVEELSYIDVVREMIPAGFAVTPETWVLC